MRGKIFTPDEATRMLPLLRRIAIDAKACTKLVDRYERALAADDDNPGDLPEKLDALATRLDELRAEIDELGCVLEDAREGVVKFYGEQGSSIVYLAWRLGEARVAYWYPTDKPWTDRRLIDGAVVANTD